MGWQPVSPSSVDSALAETAGVQAGAFLIDAIQAEVDGALIDPVQVLLDPHSPTRAVYAITAVAGPLRNYLATAWGSSGHVANKQIVAHGTIEESRQAAVDLITERLAGTGSPRRYEKIGCFSS